MKSMMAPMLVAALLACTGVAHAASLVVNGDFATDDLTGWTLSGDQTATGVTGQVFFAGPFLAPGELSQSLATGGTGPFTISFDLYETGDAPGDFFRASFGGQQVLGIQHVGLQPTRYTFTVDGTGATTLLAFDYFNVLDFYFLDNVSVSPAGVVPEPASPLLLLAGIGLLGLVGARRRSTR